MIKNRHSLASEQIDTMGGDVTTWALPEGALARFGRGSVRATAFSPDGQYFAVASAIGLWLYELPTLSPIALWDTERGMTDDVIFSPDSRRVVTSTFVENVKIWEVHSGTCIAEISLDDREICRPVFSQDGQYLVSTNYQNKNRKIYVWDSHTGSKVRETEIQHPYNVYPLCFSPDLNLLAGKNSDEANRGRNMGDGDAIVVWDTETGEQIVNLTYPERVQRFCFSPCGQHLAAGGWNGTIDVWNIASGRLETTSAEYADAKAYPYFTPEGELIVAAVSRQKVGIWNAGKGEKLDEFEHRGSVYSGVSFSENGKQLAVTSASDIQIWTKGDNANTHTLSTLHGHISTMDTVVLSPDEKTLAAGFWRDNVLLWNTERRCSYRPENEKLPPTSLNVYRSPSGNIISINTYGNSLNVWEVGKRDPLVKLTLRDVDLGRAKAFAPTGHRIASVDKNDNIHIWECTSPINGVAESESWKKHPTIINDAEFTYGLRFSQTGLAFSPDGKRLVSVSRSRAWKACLWDVDSGRQLVELSLQPPPKRRTYRESDAGIAFSPCGNIIAGGKWGEIVLWDATDGKTLMRLPQPEGSQRPITLCFSSCGEYLASGAWWQKGLKKVPIRLWEVTSGRHIATFWGHTTDVQCFAFSQDNSLLVSGGHDGAIYLWDLTFYL